MKFNNGRLSLLQAQGVQPDYRQPVQGELGDHHDVPQALADGQRTQGRRGLGLQLAPGLLGEDQDQPEQAESSCRGLEVSRQVRHLEKWNPWRKETSPEPNLRSTVLQHRLEDHGFSAQYQEAEVRW